MGGRRDGRAGGEEGEGWTGVAGAGEVNGFPRRHPYGRSLEARQRFHNAALCAILSNPLSWQPLPPSSLQRSSTRIRLRSNYLLATPAAAVGKGLHDS